MRPRNYERLLFVEGELSALAERINPNIAGIAYLKYRDNEIVKIIFCCLDANGFRRITGSKIIYITGKSLLAITKDVLKHI